MRRHRLSIQLDDPAGTLPLALLLEGLEKVRAALFYTARLDADDPRRSPRVEYRVVDLEHRSPFKVTLEALVSNGHADPTYLGHQLVRNLTRLQRASPRRQPPITDIDALEAYRRIAEPLERHTTSSLTIQSGRSRVAITPSYVQKLERVIGEDTKERGSVTGWLWKVNLHKTSRFDIYPTVGPKKVACRFPRHLRDKVIRGLAKYVTVSGELRFKQWSDFPHAIVADDIEIHPDASELPRLSDLRGMAPNATGGLSSEDFIESIRETAW